MACVDRMFMAAAQGDVATYLACFTGTQRQEIDQSLSQENRASASDSLRRTVTDLKGWAIVDPPADADIGTSCSLVVERVYAGRVDRQRMELRRGDSGWQISLVDRSLAAQPAIPYGTPVYAVEPTATDATPGGTNRPR